MIVNLGKAHVKLKASSTEVMDPDISEITKIEEMSLEELIELARKYGIIYLHESEDRTFSFRITFVTLLGMDLTARSDFKHESAVDAVKQALGRAVEIEKQFGR